MPYNNKLIDTLQVTDEEDNIKDDEEIVKEKVCVET